MTSKYVLILIWLGLMAIFAYFGRVRKTEEVLGHLEVRYQWWFAFLVFAPLIWIAATRGGFVDTAVYLYNFRNMPNEVSGILQTVKEASKDRGFTFISCLIRVFITHNEVIYLAIFAVWQTIALVFFFRKYSTSYLISVFLFVASADYVSWMLNGLRQFVAVTIILLSTPLIIKKKLLPVLLIILVASTMHGSALLMIPIVLISLGKPWNSRTMFFIGLVILIIASVGRFTNLLDDALVNTQYAHVVSDYTSWNDNGVNPLRVFVYSVPAIIAFFTRHTIERVNSPLINICTNMSIISAGLYLIAMVTSGIFLGRLPIYASLYSYILLPWEIDNLFSASSRRFLLIAMIVAYLLYYYVQMHLTWGLF